MDLKLFMGNALCNTPLSTRNEARTNFSVGEGDLNEIFVFGQESCKMSSSRDK